MEIEKYENDKNYFVEALRNGKKCILTIKDSMYTLKDKLNNSIDIPDEIKRELLASDSPNAIFECILVWLDENDNEVSYRKNDYTEPKLFIIDILELLDENLRDRSLIERKIELSSYCYDNEWLYETNASILKLPYWLYRKDKVIEGYRNVPFNGIIFKHKDSKYGDNHKIFTFTN